MIIDDSHLEKREKVIKEFMKACEKKEKESNEKDNE